MLMNSNFTMEKYFQPAEDGEAFKNDFLMSSDIDSKFEYKGYHKFGRILGRGRFGTVIECVRKCDSKHMAMKFFKVTGVHKWIHESIVFEDTNLNREEFFENKDSASLNNSFTSSSTSSSERLLPNEVACLIRATHIDSVIKILDYLPPSEDVQLDKNECSDDAFIGIVLERNTNEICLFDYLIQKQLLDEPEARYIIKQLVQINLDILKIGILHGDLKSENILIDPITKKIRLIDFGSAVLINSPQCTKVSNKLVKTFRGTNLYKPPEYLLNKCFYPRPSTVWTIGVILYDLVCGHFPFQNDTDVMSHQYKDVEFSRKNLSQGLQRLIKRCLAFYVADRINIDKILMDSWMKEKD